MDEVADYGIQMALTVLALSMTLLVQTSNLSTYVFLLGISLLIGHTTFISHNSFRKASLGSFISLFFIPLGGLTAFFAVFVPGFNAAASYFASGKSFRNFYSATALPLLLTGLLIGGGVGLYSFYDSGFEASVENQVIDFGTERTVEMVDATGLGQNQSEVAKNRTLDTVEATENYVVPRSTGDKQELRQVFSDAKTQLPERAAERAEPGVEQRTRQALEKTFSGRIPLIFFVLSVTLFYSLQPVAGILNAVSASVFKALNRVVSHS